MTHEFIISLKPTILQEWVSRLKKYCFERHQFILLPIICPWKYGSFLEIIWGNIAKCPSFLPFLHPSFFPLSFLLSSFHSFSKSNVQDHPVDLQIILKSPKFHMQFSFPSLTLNRHDSPMKTSWHEILLLPGCLLKIL